MERLSHVELAESAVLVCFVPGNIVLGGSIDIYVLHPGWLIYFPFFLVGHGHGQ